MNMWSQRVILSIGQLRCEYIQRLGANGLRMCGCGIDSGWTAAGSEWKPSRILQPDKCPHTPVVPEHAKRLGILLAALNHLHRPRRQHRQCVSERRHFMERYQSKYSIQAGELLLGKVFANVSNHKMHTLWVQFKHVSYFNSVSTNSKVF